MPTVDSSGSPLWLDIRRIVVIVIFVYVKVADSYLIAIAKHTTGAHLKIDSPLFGSNCSE